MVQCVGVCWRVFGVVVAMCVGVWWCVVVAVWCCVAVVVMLVCGYRCCCVVDDVCWCVLCRGCCVGARLCARVVGVAVGWWCVVGGRCVVVGVVLL